ncbi:MAG: NADH-quinone oxidoreductase subunit NuoG [Gammaproteobacteria bacterium]
MSATPDTVAEENLLNIEIDGRALKAQRGEMIIEAADNAGIIIPRFCYHKKLSIAANCRMCLVEVEKVPKPLPACATPVTDGMKVYTSSHRAVEAQQGTMEFLLINHPLDCPICDQGGECDLQEMSIGYGSDHSLYNETKRVVKDKDVGPLITTEFTRCIHCTRCVRFGKEIAGMRELGATGRGENMTIGTYIESAIDSEMSGNVIDLCPVGALTSKPFRYTARAWEMTSRDSIAPHDCVGSNITMKVRRDKVMRVDPKENESINEVWLSDRDRFSYEALNSEDRLKEPMIKVNGKWQRTDWNTALDFTVEALKKVISVNGIGQLGTLVSASSTLEEMHLAQKLTRGLGSANIDYRLGQQDFRDQECMPAVQWLGMSLAELEQCQSLLLIGSNVRKEQPLINHRIRKAVQNGASVSVVNAFDYDFNYPLNKKIIASPAGMELALAGIAKALIEKNSSSVPGGLAELLAKSNITESERRIADQLSGNQNSVVMLGSSSFMHPASSTVRALAGYIAKASSSVLSFVTDGANSAGANIVGVLPHRHLNGEELAGTGLHARAMLEAKLKAYILLNTEPEFDCADSAQAMAAMDGADLVVSLTPFRSDAIESYATVMLPVSPFSETSGTFVNVEGIWQSFKGVVEPLGETRPAWKVLRVLGNFFELEGFEYISTEEIRDEIRSVVKTPDIGNNNLKWLCPEQLSLPNGDLVRISDTPIYTVDNLVRRAEPLQNTSDAAVAGIQLNRQMANKLGIEDTAEAIARQGDHSLTLPVVLNERVPDQCVYLCTTASGITGLGLNGTSIEVSPAKG